MLRDLFLWSVYMGYADIAFVLLLQLKSRIGAALLAVGITQRLSLSANSLNLRNNYDKDRIAYEEYANACIEVCYKHNEQFACELLLREIPLFGNITCMQVSSIHLFHLRYEFGFVDRQRLHHAISHSSILIVLMKFLIDNGMVI
jgi:hypothetical protein